MFVFQIISNLAILVAVSVISGFVSKRYSKNTTMGKILQGLVFGFTALIGMLNPFIYSPGIIFDGRSVVLSICAFFFGPVSGLVAGLMAVLLRIYRGGDGVIVGVSVIIASVVIGLIFYYLIKKNKNTLTLFNLGILVHIAMLFLMYFLPAAFGWAVFQKIAATVMIFYPLATILIGKILRDQEDNFDLLQSLSESESKYRLIAENSADPIIILDLELKHVFVSPAVESMYGYTPAEYMNLSIAESLTQDSITKLKKVISNEFELERIKKQDGNRIRIIELEEFKKDGSIILVESTFRFIRNENLEPESILFVSRNITEWKKSQEELKNSKELLDDIMNTQPTGIYRSRVHADTQNPITNFPYFSYDFFNEYYSNFLNTTKESLINRPELIANYIHQDDLESFVQANLNANLKMQKFIWEGRMVVNSEIKWVHLESVPRSINDKEIIWTGALIDITQSKIKEQDIFEREDTFRRLFEDSTDPILLLDEVFFDCNNSALAILGYKSKSEFIGKKPSEISPKYQSNGQLSIIAAQEAIEKALLNGHNRFEWIHLKSNNEKVYCEVMLTPIILKGRNVFHVTWRDISERIKAEEIIKRTNQELKSIIDNNPLSIQIADQNGIILHANSTYIRLFGAIPESDYSIFNDPIIIEQGLSEYMQKAKMGETVYFPDLYYNLSDINTFLPERKIWTRMVIFSQNDEINAEKRYIIMQEDITESKIAKSALEESEQNYREIFNATSEAIFIHDIETGKVIDVNASMLQLYGFSTKEEALETPINAISAEDEGYDASKVAQKINMAIENKQVNFQWRSRKTNGELFWSDITLQTTQIGGEGRILAIVRDITETKRLEDSLQKRIIALTQPIENNADIIFTELFEMEQIQSIQDAFADIAGVASIITFPDGQPITKPSNFCKFCTMIRSTEKGCANCEKSDAFIGKPSLDGEPTIANCLSGGLFDGGAPIIVGGKHVANWLIGQIMDIEKDPIELVPYAYEIGVEPQEYLLALEEVPKMRKEDFTRIVASLNSFANELSQKAYQNILQARFIADKQKAQEEIQKLNSELENKVDQRTMELQSTMEELQESNLELQTMNEQMVHNSNHIIKLNDELNSALATKDKFFSIIAHDLRNPFVVLLNNAEMIETYYDRMDDKTKLKKINEIKEASNYTYTLLENLLTWARAQKGSITFVPQIYNVYDLLYRNYLTLKAQAFEKQIVITIKCLPDEVVFCDRDMFDTVIRNLVSNAIKFSNKDAEIEFGTWQLSSESPKENSDILFFVKDQGIGMDAAILGDLFKIDHKNTRKGTKGESSSGLGLLLCKEFIEKHNGKIWAESEVGNGSIFYFTLPTDKLNTHS